MVTKGAAEEMLEICSFVEVDGAAQPFTEDKLAQIRKQVAGLNARGPARDCRGAEDQSRAAWANLASPDECDWC